MFIQVDPAVSLQRALKRDAALFGTSDATERRYLERYLPGQELYLSLVHPDTALRSSLTTTTPQDPWCSESHQPEPNARNTSCDTSVEPCGCPHLKLSKTGAWQGSRQ